MKKRQESSEKNNGRILLNSSDFLSSVSSLSIFGVKDAGPSRKKNKVRLALLEKRLCLPIDSVIKNSKKISDCVLGFELFKKAKGIALYSPIRSEVDTEQIFKIAKQLGKEVYFPRVRGSFLEFFKVDDLGELKPGKFGILEPSPNSTKIHPEKTDMIIVPGVAYDRSGRRIGYGKGFYDRTLRGVNKKKLVGLAHNFQVFDRIPAGKGDIGVGLLITESGIIFAQGGLL